MNRIKDYIKSSFKHFAFFYSHLRFRFFFAAALSLGVGVLDGFGLAMFLPLLQMVGGENKVMSSEDMGNLRFLVDTISLLGFELTLVSVMVVMLFFFMMKGVVRFFESWYRVTILRYFVKKMRFENVDALVQFSYLGFVASDVGKIQNTLSGETSRVVAAYRSYSTTIQVLVLVFVYVVLAFLANPNFALMVVIGGMLSNLVYQKIYKMTKEASRKLTNSAHNYQGLLIQIVTYFKYLKSTGLIGTYSKKLKDSIAYMENISRRMGMYDAFLSSTREPLVVIVVLCVILIQVKYFGSSLGLMMLSLVFFYRSLSFLMIVQTNWNQFMQGSGALSNMKEFVDELTAHSEIVGSQAKGQFVEALTLKGVTFGYDAHTAVLRNINLLVRKNEAIAFVGESGSGKTTLVNMLTGLIPVSDGTFLIDGIDSREIDIRTFQRRIGYITQEPVIFSDTIYNNVTFWADRTPENDQRFWDALEKASIIDFVKGLPEQENSFLGNNGILVSGGQKQRFSIARELYKDIDILIMDEATSALDSETERLIQKNIDALKGRYTILIVAHRLSTIKNVDRVVLLNRGLIEGIGDFETLKANSAIFERMVSLQEV